MVLLYPFQEIELRRNSRRPNTRATSQGLKNQMSKMEYYVANCERDFVSNWSSGYVLALQWLRLTEWVRRWRGVLFQLWQASQPVHYWRVQHDWGVGPTGSLVLRESERAQITYCTNILKPHYGGASICFKESQNGGKISPKGPAIWSPSNPKVASSNSAPASFRNHAYFF